MIKTRRGDVVLVLFPNSDLRTAKRRPVLVLQRNDLDSGFAQTIVGMISTNLARAGHPSRIAVKLATVLESEIDSVLGHYPNTVALNAAVKHTFALDE